MTDASSVERAFAEAISGLGGIDVLINVAGGDTNHSTSEETTDEVWDVAAAVAFLASTDAAWITGHTLPVDGGLLTGARPEFQDGPP